MEKLNRLRRKIDQIDNNILGMLNEQAKVTLNIGKLKSRQIKPSFAPDREAQVYKRLTAANRKGLLKDETVKVTISLSKTSVDFFKKEAKKYNTQYQKMIRRLLDEYTAHQ